MKRLAPLLATVVVLSCSAPRYTYYFDHWKPNDQASTAVVPAREGEAGQQHAHSPVVISDAGQLTADIAPEPTMGVEAKAEVSSAEVSMVVTEQPAPLSRREARKQIRAAVEEMKSQGREAVPSVSRTADGDPGKNGFAIAGFILSIVSWIVLWPLAIVGIVFSAIGLKSQRKGLAIAGLVIGIVGIVVLLAAAGSVA